MSQLDQDHEDDVGAEINERELREPRASIEPDDEEMIGALLANIGYLVADIAGKEAVHTLVDSDREAQVDTLVQLDKILQILGVVRDEVAQALAGMMEDDTESIAGHAVTRNQYVRTEWDSDAAYRAARMSIISTTATDRSGDINVGDARLIERALDQLVGAGKWEPRVAGLKSLQINPNEYRSTTRATRWTVKVV